MMILMSLLAYYLLLMICLRVLHLLSIRYHWNNTSFQIGAIIGGGLAYIGLRLVCGYLIMRELFREWLILYILVAIGAIFSYDYLQAWWAIHHEDEN